MSQATKERILEAATQLFASRGFSGTSTREIARLAEVNETSLFRHFPRKQDLFWAALQSRFERVRLRKELQSGLAENKAPATVVPLMIEFLVETAAYQPELIRMLHFSFLELRPGAEQIYRQQLGPIFQALVDYLEGCLGQLEGQPEASILAVGFFTTALAHGSLVQLFTGTSSPYANPEEMKAAYSGFWLNVLSSAGKANAPRSILFATV